MLAHIIKNSKLPNDLKYEIITNKSNKINNIRFSKNY